jgi:hypothetical protein
MSDTAKIMFLWPTDSTDILGKIIQTGEGGEDDPTHVAVVLDSCLLEATALGVRKTPLPKYAHRRRQVWEIEVPEPTHRVLAAEILEGRSYSYLACFSGLLRDRFGIKLPFVSCCQDDCSEVGTIYLRCQGLEVFGIENPATITPQDLYEEMQRLGGRLVEEWLVK